MKKQTWSYAKSKGIKIPKGGKKTGTWFEGDVYSMPSSQFALIKKYEEGVKKPTALRTKKVKGKIYSQYYHKSFSLDESY